ncbi:MAG: hypothetical protein HC880_15525, partial [Bacteroidia bacterium]|nr:hypothetical protein [Bacteroidia bacterium]
LHIEFQVKDEADMILRMTLYKALLQHRYKLPVRAFVIYLGEKPAKMPTRLSDLIPGVINNFRFVLKSMRDYDHRQLVRSKIPEEIILAILGDFKGERAEEVIDKIVKNLQRAANSPAKLQKYARQLAILARLRNLVKETIKIVNTMPIEYDITQDYLYLEGKQQGKQQGKQEGKQE